MPYGLNCSYEHMEDNISDAVDLQMLYNAVEQTLALKIFNDCNQMTMVTEHDPIDLHFFRNLKLLEVQRFSMCLVKGLKALRSQLRFVTCMRSMDSLKDVLELCGADKTQGYVWSELKEAIFSHNYLHSMDASLEFVPVLENLDLSYNSIKYIENVNYLMNLKHLNLANNKIEVLPKFSNYFKLETLILKNNYIEDLTNLEDLLSLENLDVSCNCLINVETLYVLNHLKLLKKLQLHGNPLCYHKNYRGTVCTFLFASLSKDFMLDGKLLSASELKQIDSMPKLEVVMESSGSYQSISGATVIYAEGGREMNSHGSFQSFATTNTVIEAVKRYEQTSDMEISQTSVETRIEPKSRQIDLVRTLECGMQDSGIVAGHQRPASPSDSIGSANSLHECLQITSLKRFSESDISILSNPSQSSIEVLSENTPKCVQSTIVLSSNLTDMCPDEELKKVGEEMHRSL